MKFKLFLKESQLSDKLLNISDGRIVNDNPSDIYFYKDLIKMGFLFKGYKILVKK